MKPKTHLLFITLCTLLMLAAASAASSQKPKLTLAQVEQLLKSQAPDELVASQIRSRGLNFVLTHKMADEYATKMAGPQTLAALRERIRAGGVRILTQPGTLLLLDGKDANTVGAGGSLVLADLPEGNHELTARKQGFQDTHLQFALAADEDKLLVVPLQWLGGFLTVSVQPADAAVKVTGPQSFDGRGTDLNCLPGSYTITASLEGYLPQTRTFQVAAGEHHAEQVQLAVDAAFVTGLSADAKSKLAAGDPGGAIQSAREALKLTPGDASPEEILAEASFLTGDFQDFFDAGTAGIRAGGSVTFPLMHVHSFPHRLVHDVTLTLDGSGMTYKPVGDTQGCKLQAFTQPFSALKSMVVQQDLSGSVELHLEFASQKIDLMPAGSQVSKPQHQKGVINLGIGNPQYIPIQSPGNAEQLLGGVAGLIKSAAGQ